MIEDGIEDEETPTPPEAQPEQPEAAQDVPAVTPELPVVVTQIAPEPEQRRIKNFWR